MLFILGIENFNTNLALNCTPSPRDIPLVFGGAIFGSDTGPDSPDAFKSYDRLVGSSVPFILAMWSNTTTKAALGKDGDEPWAETRIGCAKPPTVKAGSRVLPSDTASSATPSKSSGKTLAVAQTVKWGFATLLVLTAGYMLF